MQNYARIYVWGHYLFRDAKTVTFEEQVMSKDKYTRIFSRELETITFIILQIFCNARYKIFTNSLLFPVWDVFFFSVLWYDFGTNKNFPSFVATTKRSIILS